MDTDSIDYSARAKFWKSMANFNLDMLAELRREHETFRAALETIADIAEGSGTANSLPHIAKIARLALTKGRGSP